MVIKGKHWILNSLHAVDDRVVLLKRRSFVVVKLQPYLYHGFRNSVTYRKSKCMYKIKMIIKNHILPSMSSNTMLSKRHSIHFGIYLNFFFFFVFFLSIEWNEWTDIWNGRVGTYLSLAFISLLIQFPLLFLVLLFFCLQIFVW